MLALSVALLVFVVASIVDIVVFVLLFVLPFKLLRMSLLWFDGVAACDGVVCVVVCVVVFCWCVNRHCCLFALLLVLA